MPGGWTQCLTSLLSFLRGHPLLLGSLSLSASNSHRTWTGALQIASKSCDNQLEFCLPPLCGLPQPGKYADRFPQRLLVFRLCCKLFAPAHQFFWLHHRFCELAATEYPYARGLCRLTVETAQSRELSPSMTDHTKAHRMSWNLGGWYFLLS